MFFLEWGGLSLNVARSRWLVFPHEFYEAVVISVFINAPATYVIALVVTSLIAFIISQEK